ncbi:MAG TPA: primosomal protein N' [Solirubrobacteraceae bacterium]|nr:primosomal protein N' [Solirubrobacteraceae bacterium]
MSAIAQVEPMTTARALRGPFDYRLPEGLRGEVAVGSMLVVPFGRREILGVVTALRERSDVDETRLLAPLRSLDGDPPAPPTLPADLVVLAEWLAEEYCSTFSRALTLVLPPAASRRLSARKRRRAAPSRAEHPQVGSLPERAGGISLTPEQSEVVDRLVAALAAGGPVTRLLAGITGSGKTEVYLRVTAQALRAERGAIVMVPEIALTPQIVTRFTERFGDTVAVLHSRLTLAQRREEWRRLRMGEARVCVGPRSAVFAPIERLGLIVIDEEHDPSYKHEGDPRYDARTVAARRAEDCGALLLLGSATPRPESVHAAGAEGVLRLAHRVDRRPLPRVEVLDMRECDHALHPSTAQALAELRAGRAGRGGKAIVLLNRRGWSNFLTCRSCGQAWCCPQCDVALVLHRAQRILACHHCGHREPVPTRCDCGSTALARHGAGTERLAHELMLTLGEEFPVLRLDADTVGEKPAADGGVGELLRRFEQAPCGVLVGTQMVAKGHDFADVSLGIVLDADATLRFPDFRAEERTFALVCQLAGRVGRGGEGRVMVQTMAPEARSILDAARHDSDGFLAGELTRREALAYPPFSTLVRIVCAAERADGAQAAAQQLRARLVGGGEPLRATVLGPAPLFRLRGRERRALVVKASPNERAEAVRRIGEQVGLLAAAREHRQVAFSVDVDPQ